MKSHKKQYAVGAMLSYITIVFNILSGLLYTPWMIKAIGNEHYALYSLAISIISIFMIDFGIGGAVSKFLADFYANGKEEQASIFLGTVYRTFLIIAIIIAGCLLFFYFLIDEIYVKLSLDELIVFKRLFVIVGCYSVFLLPFTPFNGILTANEKFIELKFCGLGQNVFNVLFISLCLVLKGNVYSLVIVHSFTNAFFIFIKYIIIRKNNIAKANFKESNVNTLRNLFNFCIWTTINGLAQRCIFNIMPTIIAAVIGSTEVAIFSLAATMEGYVYNFTQAINGMFLPKISKIYTRENAERDLLDFMCKIGRYHIYTLGLLYIGFILIGEQFIELWLGKEYHLVYGCAVVLIFPSLIDTPQQVAKTALLVKDILKDQTKIYITMAIINISLSFVLIKHIGVIGAAISIMVSYIFRTIMFNRLYVRRLSINIIDYFLKTYSGWIVVGMSTVLFSFILIRKISIDSWLGLMIKAFIISIIYICNTLVINKNLWNIFDNKCMK